MDDLKPCPFCGSKAVLAHDAVISNTYSYVRCDKCRARIIGIPISTEYSSDEKAIEAWNRRLEIEQLPSAQPEIIRCKDCAKRKYCRTSTVWAVAPSDDWYCADAERRTE